MDFDHRRQDVDAHFGHPDISFPKDKCRVEDIGPQNGSTHAFKWDLKAKMDEPRGKLLFAMPAIPWFSDRKTKV